MEIKGNRTSLDDLKKKAFKNPKVKNEYDRLAPIYEEIREKIKQRVARETEENKNS